MKRIILAAMLLLPIGALAEIPEFTKLSQKYQSNEDVTVVSLEGDMLKNTIKEDAPVDIAQYLDSITIVVSEDSSASKDLAKSIEKILNKLALAPMINITEDDTNVNIYTKREESHVSDLIIYVKEESATALIIMTGAIPDDLLNYFSGTLTNSVMS